VVPVPIKTTSDVHSFRKKQPFIDFTLTGSLPALSFLSAGNFYFLAEPIIFLLRKGAFRFLLSGVTPSRFTHSKRPKPSFLYSPVPTDLADYRRSVAFFPLTGQSGNFPVPKNWRWRFPPK
jgi:hypothetical protein